MGIPVTYVGNKYAKTSQSNSKQPVDGFPRLVGQAEFKILQPLNTATKVRIPGFVWSNTPITAGVVFTTSQGSRLVLEANLSRVIYVLVNPSSKDHNKIFMQNTKGFIADVVFYPMEEAGRRGQTIKKVAEYEIQIIIGIFSVTSWAAFTIVMSMDVLEFTVNNQAKFPKWKRIIKACLQTRKDLQKYAPTLYNKLVYATLLIAWEGSQFASSRTGEISDSMAEAAIKDPKVAGRGIGIIVGKLGQNAMSGRISVLSAIWTILFTVATKSLSAIPGAVKNATDSFKEKQLKEKLEMANQLLNIIKQADIKLTKEEALEIISEVYAHPHELKDSLSNLVRAFNNEH